MGHFEGGNYGAPCSLEWDLTTKIAFVKSDGNFEGLAPKGYFRGAPRYLSRCHFGRNAPISSAYDAYASASKIIGLIWQVESHVPNRSLTSHGALRYFPRGRGRPRQYRVALLAVTLIGRSYG